MFVSILSDITSSVTSLASVTGFFFIDTSSLTYGVLVTSTSSFFNGILISSCDVTGPCEVSVCPPAGCLLSIDTSSWATGTSTVFVSVTGSFVIVAWLSSTLLFTSSFSSVIGTVTSYSASSGVVVADSGCVDDDLEVESG